MDEFKTKTITVTQESAATKDKVTVGSCDVGSDYSYDGEGFTKKDIGYSRLDLNGISQTQYGAGTVYAKTHFVVVDETAHKVKDYSKTNVDWASCEWQNDGKVMTDCRWWLSLNANMTGKTRVAYVALVFANDGEYDYPAEPKVVKITQTSSFLNATASFVNASSEKVSKDGGVVKTTLSLTIDGTAQADVDQAIKDYGLTLETSSAVESRTIAANGEVTLNVKANATSAERKITLTLKHNNTVLATTEFTQEAGEGGAACAYTYNLDFTNAADENHYRYFGMRPNFSDNGHYLFIRNVKLNGESVTLSQEIAEEILAYAIRSEEPTAEELAKAAAGRTPSATAVTAHVAGFSTSDIYVTIKTHDGMSVTRVAGYNNDGSFYGAFVIWTD